MQDKEHGIEETLQILLKERVDHSTEKSFSEMITEIG